MNNGYYETLDENFTQALKLYESEYTREELMEFLQNGNIAQKQIAALKLETVASIREAGILVSNLTGQDGKIREAVSLKLAELMSDKNLLPYFETVKNYGIFADAIIDINANICRNTISAVKNLKDNDEFCAIFTKKLAKMSLNLLDIIEKFDFCDGKYKVNKEVFKLYWCLETLYNFHDKTEFADLKRIILRAKNIDEYTIREKAAKILTHEFSDPELVKARNELRNDKNCYVRRF